MSPVALNLVIAAFALLQGVRYGPRALAFLRALRSPESRLALRPVDAIPLAVVAISLLLLVAAARVLVPHPA